jgi:hypothetical protein
MHHLARDAFCVAPASASMISWQLPRVLQWSPTVVIVLCVDASAGAVS